MQEKIFDLLLNEEEISWKNILYDLVKTEQMGPWNVNITLLTHKYIEVIKEMQDHDLKVSGKIVLAAAILLKIKSTHLVDKDIARFDSLIKENDEEMPFDEDFFSELGFGPQTVKKGKGESYALIPRNPQPRNRKVSIHDLVEALQRALTSKKKMLYKIRPQRFNLPNRKNDIMEVIRDVYHKVVYYSNKDKNQKIVFTKLLPANAQKSDKVYTFVPLLHLENQHKVEMEQEGAFGEIKISLLKEKKE